MSISPGYLPDARCHAGPGQRNTSDKAFSTFSAGGKPLYGAVWMTASITSVRATPRFNAAWPKRRACSGIRNAVNAATATNAR